MALIFTKQVEKDISSETKEIQTKLLILFKALEDGANLSMPVSRSMQGHANLKELRVKDASGIVRVFYIIESKGVIYILHMFRKKTQKTPPQEIETALKRYKLMKG